MLQRDDGPLTQREQIPTKVFADSRDASVAVAQEIADLIRQRGQEGRACVLGLATGSTPTGVYAELVRMHREGSLSFDHVVTFNLDEYYPMERNELQSYVRFMHEQLFDHVDMRPEHVHIPDGTLPIYQTYDYCQAYEQQIVDAGGIDLQILGIGRTGHIGFNERGSNLESRTRLITLDRVTRLDAASDFFGDQNVPRRALTMGVGTILQSARIILIAFGEHKAPVIRQTVEGPVTPTIAASYLQKHPDAEIILDTAAAAKLTRRSSPWELAPIAWDEPTIRKAAIWLAQRTEKPILKLTDDDYNEAGLQDLVAAHGPAYDININVFRQMQDTITGWPGGKPGKVNRPGDRRLASDDIFPKKVLIFSPHPDDDVISMGGTLTRLVEQGHDVHIAYQTSGGIAVFDEDAIRFADFAAHFNDLFGIEMEQAAKIDSHIQAFLRDKQPGQIDSEEVRKIKALIRRGEARAAGRACGVDPDHLHFLDMPFYETGRVRKRMLADTDLQLVADMLKQVQPNQVYAAGDLSDPHGTHRVCLTAILQALDTVKDNAWYNGCELWLYRGAWQEWEPDEIHMAVPLSPSELMRKRAAVFKHESQKDKALFPGNDDREFWQRAEDRNRDTAKLYDNLGLAEYEAIEGFVRWELSNGSNMPTD